MDNTTTLSLGDPLEPARKATAQMLQERERTFSLPQPFYSDDRLFEIREEARRFIAQENARESQQWDVLEPNAKVLVPRCAVPLQAQWTPKSLGRSQPSVVVICTAAVPNTVMKRWDVHVPVKRKPGHS